MKDVYTHFRDILNPNTTLSTALADYIFVPISYLLKQPQLGDAQIELVLKVLTLLIRHCWTVAGSIPYVLAKQLFPLITFLTGGSSKTGDKSEINAKSDELKIAGSETLMVFFKSLAKQKDAKVYDFFSNVETLPALGHAVTVLLHFAEHGKTIELQLQAMKSLDVLYFELIRDGEILSYILPGNVSSLTKIIAAPGLSSHYTVIIEAIQLLGKLLVLVYKDEELRPKIKELESIEEVLDGDELDVVTIEEADLKKVHRTNKWLKATSGQVKLALQNIKRIDANSRIEVKKTLLTFCQNILSYCLYSLKDSIAVIVNILSYLSNDKRLEIDSKKLIVTESSKSLQLFNKVVSNELSSNIDSFSSVLQSPNEAKILSTISSIEFTVNHVYDDFLVSKLVNAAKLELSDTLRKSFAKSKAVNVLNTVSDLMVITKEAGQFGQINEQLTVFDKLFSEEVEIKLSNLFKLVGSQKNPSNIIEELLSDDTSPNYEKGVVLWISNSLMDGYFNSIRNSKIVDEFLEFEGEVSETLETPEFLYSLLDYSKIILDDVSEIAPTQEVEFVNSIALDTIGIAAYHLRGEFRYELVDYLYPVIDSMASLSEPVRKHALNACMIISNTLYHGSLYELVLDNSDYLVDAISIRLTNAMTTRATAILAVCTKIAGFKIIESFKDVIEIIFSLLDYYHGYEDLCIGFFVLFEIIADETRKKYLNDYGANKLEYFDSSSTYSPWGLRNLNQLKNLLDKSQRDVLVEPKPKESEEEGEIEGEINAPDSDDEDQELPEDIPAQEEKWTSPIPENLYKLLQQIMFYGERLLTHPSVKLHIQILRTYEKMIPILATSTKHLYPIVASIWPIVCTMVNNSDPKVVIPGSKVMAQMLEYTGGFLSTRFTDFWKQLKTNNILITANKSVSVENKVVLPGINSKAYESLIDMLVIGINTLGRLIPDVITEDIIRNCVAVVSDIERFGVGADIAWSIKHEKYKLGKELKRPEPILTEDNITYKFIDCN